MRLVRMTAVGLAVLLASCAQQSPPAAVSYFPPSFSIYDTDAWLGAGVSGPDIAAWQDIGATPPHHRRQRPLAAHQTPTTITGRRMVQRSIALLTRRAAPMAPKRRSARTARSVTATTTAEPARTMAASSNGKTNSDPFIGPGSVALKPGIASLSSDERSRHVGIVGREPMITDVADNLCAA